MQINKKQNFVKIEDKTLYVKIKVIPNAKITKFVDYTYDYVRVKINAPAINNCANEQLIKYIAKLFRINKSNVKLEIGEKSQYKTIKINNIFIEDFLNILEKELKNKK